MKAKMSIGGMDLVMDLKVANDLLEQAIANSEVITSKWNSAKDGKPAHYTKHIYDLNHDDNALRLELITDAQYQIYKLAGHPEGKSN